MELAENRKELESVSPSVDRPLWITDARKRKVLNFLKSQAKQEELEEFAAQHLERPIEKKRPKKRSTAASSSAGPVLQQEAESSSAGPAPKQEEAVPKKEIFEESHEAVIREKPLKPHEEIHGKIQKNRQPGDQLTLVEKWGSLKIVLDDSDF